MDKMTTVPQPDQVNIVDQKSHGGTFQKWLLIISAIVVPVVFILFMVGISVVASGLYTGIHGTPDQSIIEGLRKDGAYRIYTWDTWAGRIYANQCSGPPYARSGNVIPTAVAQVNVNASADPCGYSCFDGGTTFYDARGHETVYCGDWGGVSDSLACKLWLNRLKISDADYREPDCLK